MWTFDLANSPSPLSVNVVNECPQVDFRGGTKWYHKTKRFFVTMCPLGLKPWPRFWPLAFLCMHDIVNQWTSLSALNFGKECTVVAIYTCLFQFFEVFEYTNIFKIAIVKKITVWAFIDLTCIFLGATERPNWPLKGKNIFLQLYCIVHMSHKLICFLLFFTSSVLVCIPPGYFCVSGNWIIGK